MYTYVMIETIIEHKFEYILYFYEETNERETINLSAGYIIGMTAGGGFMLLIIIMLGIFFYRKLVEESDITFSISDESSQSTKETANAEDILAHVNGVDTNISKEIALCPDADVDWIMWI